MGLISRVSSRTYRNNNMTITIDLEQWQNLAVGFFVGAVFMKLYNEYQENQYETDSECSDPPDEMLEAGDNIENYGGEIKMVIAVRTDLKMGKGKVCAQVGHGVLAAGQKCEKKHPKMFNKYRWFGQKKICVKVGSEDELETIAACARSLGLIAEVIADAGHTQIAPGSKTVCAIGPGPAELIDEVTGNLKLL